jgi:transposase
MLKPLGPLRQRKEDVYQNVIALDPGVRTFLTGFDTKGNGFKFGKYGIKSYRKRIVQG